MTRGTLHHTCPADGCTAQLPRESFLCREHWLMIPEYARMRVVRAWRLYASTKGEATGPRAQYMEARAHVLRLVNQAVEHHDGQ